MTSSENNMYNNPEHDRLNPSPGSSSTSTVFPKANEIVYKVSPFLVSDNRDLKTINMLLDTGNYDALLTLIISRFRTIWTLEMPVT